MFYRVEFFSLGRVRSGLKIIVEVPLCSSHQDTQAWIKRLHSSCVSSPSEREFKPEPFYHYEIIEFLRIDSSNATNKENMRLDVNREIITPRVPQFSAELNVENLCGKQTTQLKAELRRCCTLRRRLAVTIIIIIIIIIVIIIIIIIIIEFLRASLWLVVVSSNPQKEQHRETP